MKRMMMLIKAPLLASMMVVFVFSAHAENLIVLAKNGDLAGVKDAILHGSNVNARKGCLSPLDQAAGHGYAAIVKLLIANGADINGLKGCMTPLASSVYSGHSDIVKYLISKDARYNKTWLLGSAARGGILWLVEKLVSEGADVNYRDDFGGTPLMDAAYKGHAKIVDFLLRHGADPSMTDEGGILALGATALHRAAMAGSEATVKILLAYGADVNAINKNGKTP